MSFPVLLGVAMVLGTVSGVVSALVSERAIRASERQRMIREALGGEE